MKKDRWKNPFDLVFKKNIAAHDRSEVAAEPLVHLRRADPRLLPARLEVRVQHVHEDRQA